MGNDGGAEAQSPAQNENGSKDLIILGTRIHCEGCASEIIKCLIGFEGVEDVKVNSKEHRVMVKGVHADPLNVLERVKAKCSNKHVILISPKPKPKPKPDPPPKMEDEDDNEPLVMIIVVRVFMHCENCAQETKSCLERMKGVQMVTVDAPNKQMTVIGGIEPQEVVEYLYRRAGKYATIVKEEYQDKEEEKGNKRLGRLKKTSQHGNEEKKDEKKKEEKAKDIYYHYPPQYNPDPLYPCLLLNDENPQACQIM